MATSDAAPLAGRRPPSHAVLLQVVAAGDAAPFMVAAAGDAAPSAGRRQASQWDDLAGGV